MKTEKWISIDYNEVNMLKEHYANQKGAKAYSMLSPSDVPTHFLLEQSNDTLEITFRYMNESEKTHRVSVIPDAMTAKVGKSSKKIYYIKINIKSLNELMASSNNKRDLIRKAAETKVKKTSYSAIKEIYIKYIKKEHLDFSRAEFAF